MKCGNSGNGAGQSERTGTARKEDRTGEDMRKGGYRPKGEGGVEHLARVEHLSCSGFEVRAPYRRGSS